MLIPSMILSASLSASLSHRHSLILSHRRQIKGTQDKDFSYSFFDSLSPSYDVIQWFSIVKEQLGLHLQSFIILCYVITQGLLVGLTSHALTLLSTFTLYKGCC